MRSLTHNECAKLQCEAEAALPQFLLKLERATQKALLHASQKEPNFPILQIVSFC